MYYRFFLLVSLQVTAGIALAAPLLPVEVAQELVDRVSATKPDSVQGTLRISAVSRTSENAQVAVSGVLVCTKKTCYRAGVNRSVEAAAMPHGALTKVAELAIPYGEIESVQFLPAGPGSAKGIVRLSKPLQLTQQLRSGEVVIIFDRERSGDYAAKYAVANYSRPHGTNVLVDSESETVAKLAYGAVLSVPAGAVGAPTLLNVAVHDTGDDFPLIDIFPPLELLKRASLQMPALHEARKSIQTVPGRAVKVPPPSAVNSKLVTEGGFTKARSALNRTISITRTGVFRQAESQVSESVNELNTMNLAAAGSTAASTLEACLADLQHPLAPSIIDSGIAPTGTVNLTWCEQKAPFVHITVTNLNDPRERFTMRHEPEETFFGSPLMLPLRRITDWAPYTQSMVNGFTWEGDPGNLSGQYGLALGYLLINGKLLGDNRVGGGYCLNNCGTAAAADINKFVFQAAESGPNHIWRDAQGIAVFGTYPNFNNYVSSSTSIMKSGICGTTTDRDSWSAMGTTPAGRMIFMSSTSGNQTNVAELCEIFKALGATNAMRLDGGSATSMTINGILQNPIVGMKSFVFGTTRHIGYALKLSHVGW